MAQNFQGYHSLPNPPIPPQPGMQAPPENSYYKTFSAAMLTPNKPTEGPLDLDDPTGVSNSCAAAFPPDKNASSSEPSSELHSDGKEKQVHLEAAGPQQGYTAASASANVKAPQEDQRFSYSSLLAPNANVQGQPAQPMIPMNAVNTNSDGPQRVGVKSPAMRKDQKKGYSEAINVNAQTTQPIQVALAPSKVILPSSIPSI